MDRVSKLYDVSKTKLKIIWLVENCLCPRWRYHSCRKYFPCLQSNRCLLTVGVLNLNLDGWRSPIIFSNYRLTYKFAKYSCCSSCTQNIIHLAGLLQFRNLTYWNRLRYSEFSTRCLEACCALGDCADSWAALRSLRRIMLIASCAFRVNSIGH